MSEVKVNKISPRTNCGTVQLGDSGDTITIPAGATITNSGTAAGFGSTGEVSWDTTKKTSGFTAVSGVGYFCDTTSAAFTVTLPATPSAGNVVAVSDYAGTFGTNNLTIGRNGSNINGSASDFVISKNNVTAQFIYVDATQGWRVVFTGSQTGEGLQEGYICATGGTITTCGDYKIHTFTGPGTFTVSSLACSPANDVVDYMVVAAGAAGGGGGRSGAQGGGGGGGAGGFRESSGAASGCYTRSPLGACVSALPVSAQGYPITVGGGGSSVSGENQGGSGANSVFSTITSAGGGGGGQSFGHTPYSPDKPGVAGGSGGGGGTADNPSYGAGGAGNTPPVSPPQGTAGGPGYEPLGGPPGFSGAGGGGATAAGADATPSTGGNGGAGATSSINGTPTARAGGGGGGSYAAPGSGGAGGGGAGGTDQFLPNSGTAGTANTGGGGGGANTALGDSGNGGSGVVIIRYKYQ